MARLRPLERKALLDEMAAMVIAGELGLDSQAFARIVKLSQRAIAKLEDDPRASPTLETLRRVFAPFGGTVTLTFPQVHDAEPLVFASRSCHPSLVNRLGVPHVEREDAAWLEGVVDAAQAALGRT